MEDNNQWLKTALAKSEEKRNQHLLTLMQQCGVDHPDLIPGFVYIRHRPAMWIGDTGIPGFHHLFKEIFDNSIEEVMAGLCNQVLVTVHSDGSLSVRDNGRGIPLQHLRVVLTELHAGGKLPASRTYKIGGGLHGVGTSCVNALSEWMETTVWQAGRQVTVRTERGEIVEEREEAFEGQTGTRIRFKPDPQIFGDSAWSPERLLAIQRQQAFLNPKLTLTFTDESLGCDPQVLNFPGGVAEWAREHAAARRPIHQRVIAGSGKKDDVEVDVAFYFTQEDPVWLAFGNGVQLGVMGTPGTPLTGFRQGVARTLSKWAKKYGREFEPRTAQAGVAVILSVRVYDPVFNGPMKDSLQNPEAASAVWAVTAMALEAHFTRFPDEAEAIVSGMLGDRGV
ncbi:ATP-binding protein [Armatimonas sp.]|uniref:ATP-binding protein n=1 Tax=Armatimonas sp. TaxID=1872638 RepID=UPI00374D6826